MLSYELSCDIVFRFYSISGKHSTLAGSNPVRFIALKWVVLNG